MPSAEARVLLDVGPFGLSKSDREGLRDACGSSVVVETTTETPLEKLSDQQFDVLLSEVLPGNLDGWQRLRFVQLVSAGVNHLKGNRVWDTDIVVANASGTHAVAIGQYVTCAVLMMAHHMPRAAAPAATRQWAREALDCTLLRGQTVGIIGYGSIGRECARQLTALGMRAVCLKRSPHRRRDDGFIAFPNTGDVGGILPERWFGPQQLKEMLPLCDVVVLTVPCTNETLDMIGAGELAGMKRTAIVINVARGGIVNETALATALRNGQLAGAVVDCFVTEPLPSDHPFFDTPNMILTPHVAGVSDRFWPVMATLLRENLRRFTEGRAVLNRVNPQVGY